MGGEQTPGHAEPGMAPPLMTQEGKFSSIKYIGFFRTYNNGGKF